MRVVLTYEYKDEGWYAHMEDYTNLQITSRHGPWASGLEAATEFFKRIGTAPVSAPAWDLDEYVGG